MISGLLGGSSELYSTIVEIVKKMLSKIKATMGMGSSSSADGKSIGGNFLSSMGLGALEVAPDLERDFARMTGRLAFSAASGFGGLASGRGNTVQNNDQFQFFGPTILQGNTTPNSLGARLKGRRY